MNCPFADQNNFDCELLIAVREFMDHQDFSITCQFLGREKTCPARQEVEKKATKLLRLCPVCHCPSDITEACQCD